MWLWRATTLLGAVMAAGAARAANGDAEQPANSVSLYIQSHLFRWGLWTTGVGRLDNAELYGMAACVLLLGFAVSGIAIILFKDRGLGFRTGWMLSIPTILAAMIAFSFVRPYPTVKEAPFLFGFAALAGLVVLTIAGVIKGSIVTTAKAIVKTPAPPQQNPTLTKRLKMATRGAANIRNDS